MSARRWVLIATLALCTLATVGIAVLSMLDKQGRFTARLPGHVFVLASPFVGIAAGAVWWRQGRRLPFAGLAVAALAAGLSLWGKASDYLAWSRTPPGQEAMYFGGFFAMLSGWALCLGFLGAGMVAWLAALRGRKSAEPISRPNGSG
jgi:hypothetical protein